MSDPKRTTINQVLDSLKFDDDGMIPAIAQQHDTGEVLMMAWMNREAISTTISEARACYWSRTRQSLWRKGETSGQFQTVKEVRWDCDSDTILLLVDQAGVACHTGRHNCFFNALRDNEITVIADVQTDPKILYPSL